MGIELWAPLGVAVAIFGVIVAIAIFFWNKVDKLDDRLRNLEIEFARLDERTKPAVAYVEGGDGTFRITWQRGKGE